MTQRVIVGRGETTNWLSNKDEADGAFCYEEAALFDSSKAILRPVIRCSQETSDHISVVPAGQKNTSSTIWTDQRKQGTNWPTKMPTLWKGQQPLTATVSNLLFSPCDSIWKLHYAHILLQAIDVQQLLEPIFKIYVFKMYIIAGIKTTWSTKSGECFPLASSFILSGTCLEGAGPSQKHAYWKICHF